jgi:hypothetical protein
MFAAVGQRLIKKEDSCTCSNSSWLPHCAAYAGHEQAMMRERARFVGGR